METPEGHTYSINYTITVDCDYDESIKNVIAYAMANIADHFGGECSGHIEVTENNLKQRETK